MQTKINWREKWLHDCFDTNFTLVMRVPPLDEKTNMILEANMRYYLENSKKLMPGGHDDEDTDEEEESDWLEEDGLP